MQQKTIRNKKVLLVVNSSSLHEKLILHGINLSRRMDASLEILHLLDEESVNRATQSFKKSIKKIQSDQAVGYIQLVKHRGLTTETVEYAQHRRNILCVVLCLKGDGLPDKKGIRQKKFEEITQLLNCPVVLYTKSSIG